MQTLRVISASAASTASDKLQLTVARGAACDKDPSSSATGTSVALRSSAAAQDVYCVKISCKNSVLNCGTARVSIKYMG